MNCSLTPNHKKGTLLVFSTYPIRKPRHGGQIRSSALMVEYKKVFKKVVRTAVFNPTVYSKREYGKGDIPSPPQLTDQIVHKPELEPWFLGNSPITSTDIHNQITDLIRLNKPDLILFEQPYLFLGLRDLLEKSWPKIPIVYSAQNVESEMMKDIFSKKLLEKDYEQELEQLESYERALVIRSIGTIAVSDEDKKTYTKWGGKNIIVQGNGTYPLKSSKLKRLRVRRVMKQLGISSYALFVGSSHSPNIEGFLELVGTRLGFLPPDSMIFLAGDIARGLQPEVHKIDPKWGEYLWTRLYNWGRVSEKTLSALITEASCILVPITSGGGSNLKTAEALVSGKPIIATKVAMRGFNQFESLKAVKIANNPSDFKKALLFFESFCSNDQEISQVEKLFWKSQLDETADWLHGLSIYT